MNTNNIFKLILNKKWLIFWLVLFGAVLAFDMSVIQAPQYRATSKILIIQKQTQGQDIYTISKSAQYLSQVLKESVYSDDFFEKVIGSTDKLSADDFPTTPKERRKAWKKSVKITTLQDLGVLKIDVYSSQSSKIEDINKAITNVLISSHQGYHGAGDNAEVKMLDYPLVSQKPVKPNLWLNTLIGGILGLLLAIFLIFNRPSKLSKPIEEASFQDRRHFSVPEGGF